MGQAGWRLPDDLLKRVRVHCAQTGERQNAFVERALEKALGDEQGTGPSGTPRRSPAPDARETDSRGRASRSAPSRTRAKKPAAPLGKGFVPPRPKAKGK